MSRNRILNRFHKGNQSPVNRNSWLEAKRLIELWDVSKPVTMDFYNQFSREAWTLACVNLDVHQIITQELVAFVDHLIKDKSAIEICSGVGTLGRALDIPLIDRKVSEDPRAQAYINLFDEANRPKTLYPPQTIHMTANKAFRELKPDWVVGSWVTQKLIKGKIGMMFGPMEEEFVEQANYIHIGTSHLDVHRLKRINKLPHYIIEADWLVNRSMNKKPSQIRIWSKNPIDFDLFPEHLDFDYYLPKY